MGSIWWTAQILGLTAFSIGCVALLHPNDRFHRLGSAISALIDVAHWVLLGAMTAGVTALLISIRVFVAEWLQGKPSYMKYCSALIFCFLFGATAALTWQDLFSMLPFGAALVATYALFYLEASKLRWHLVFCNGLWLIYSIHVESIAGVLTAILSAALLIHAMWKLKWA